MRQDTYTLHAQLMYHFSKNPPVTLYRQFNNFQLKQVLQVKSLHISTDLGILCTGYFSKFQNHTTLLM